MTLTSKTGRATVAALIMSIVSTHAAFAATGQSTLEVYAELDAAGVGGITQMPNGQVIIGYHPFYLTPTSVALLNADRKSTTLSDAEWQSCKNADGTWKSDFNRCVDWVLGLHADVNGILWLLDSAKSTDKASGRPAGLVPKLVGWDTKKNQLARIIPISDHAGWIDHRRRGADVVVRTSAPAHRVFAARWSWPNT
jgi:hypothetical protein